jgi:hypothetical protein
MPESMEAIVQRVWSLDIAAREFFEDILEALRQIQFKMTPAVDGGKVIEFVVLVDPSAVVKPVK